MIIPFTLIQLVSGCSLNPTQLSDFQCVGVNVTGSIIPRNESIMSKFRTSSLGEACLNPSSNDHYPGKFIGFTRLQNGASFSMDLEPGEYHFQLIGIKTMRTDSSGNVICPSIDEMLHTSGIAAATSRMYMIGETQTTIGGATNIEVQAQMMRFLWPACLEGNHFYNYTKITIGDGFMCGIRPDTGVECWGLNSYGTVGNGTLTNQPAPIQITVNSSGTWSDIVTGHKNTCAKHASGWHCWGASDRGQLGFSGIGPVKSPFLIPE